MRLKAFLLLLSIVMLPGQASAAIIGTFGWDYDPLFFGSTFAVTNESSSDFEDAVIDLYAPGASDPFQTLSIGTVQPGETLNQFDDLSLFTVPDDLNRAVLRLLFQSTSVTTELLASSLDGDPSFLLGGGVAIEAEVAQTPEPSTLLLGITGAGAMLMRRRRYRHRQPDRLPFGR